MTGIEILRQPAAQAMGWALIHFVWQGALIGLIAAVVLAILRRSASDVRYVVAAIALSLMLTLPVVTAVQVWRASADAANPIAATDRIADGTSAKTTAVRAQGAAIDVDGPATAVTARPSAIALLDAVRLEPWLPLLVIGWFCGVVMLTLRLMSGWLWVQRMKTHGRSPAGDVIQQAASRLARQLHIRRSVQLWQSTMVEVPTVIGWLKPVVLLPISALAGLTPQQLEAVLAHELAHIRRHDYLVNLLQTLVETLLFYHPAVWWLSRQIRIERENCCDDLAVSLCGDPFTYARALAELEQLRGGNGRLVLAATGGSLLQRVRRLLGAPTHAGRAPGWLAGVAAGLLIAVIAAGAATSDAFQAPRSQGDRSSRNGARETRADAVSSPREVLRSGRQTVRLIGRDVGREGRDTTRQFRAQALKTIRGIERDLRALFNSTRAAIAPQIPPLPPVPPDPPEAPLPVLAVEAALTRSGQALGTEQSSEALVTAARAMEAQARAAQAALAASAGTGEAVLADASARLRASHAEAAATMAALAPSAGLMIGKGQSHGTFSWSNNGEKLEVKYDGEVEFTDDDADVKRLSPGGYLRIRDGGWLGGRTVEFSADATGTITRRYFAGIGEKPFEPEGREWLARMLPRFIRQTGIGAPARVARLLKSGGTPAVLGEITKIEGSWGKRIYFKELLAQGAPDAGTLRQILAQAGRAIESDFELASLLIGAGDTFLKDESVRQAYFEAARSIQSDFELHRVYSAALKRGPVSPAVLAGILESSRSIDSDFELASLLIEIVRLQPIDRTARAPLFAALATVASDFEHGRVLAALAQRTDLPDEVTLSMVESSGSIASDFEAASFLVQFVKRQPIEGAMRAPFFRAVESIQSSFERGRVLKAIVARPDASKETLLEVLRSARAMGGSFETSQVLQAVAASHPLTGESRDAYIDAAEKLGDFEQGRALAALVRNERRK